jgi:hypothetical protein
LANGHERGHLNKAVGRGTLEALMFAIATSSNLENQGRKRSIDVG